MNETQSYQIKEGVQSIRADKALAMAFPEHSRVAFQRAFDADRVFLRGKPLSRSSSVTGGDVIEFSFPEVVPTNMKPSNAPLDVLFEDKHLLVINKASGMVVHPGAGTDEKTLVHALLGHCKGGLSGIGGIERPGIVHRLDRETSGAMLVAKTDTSHRSLAEQFANRTVIKEYVALVAGAPELLSGSIKKSVGRNPRQRHKMAVVEEGPGGRPSHTDWSVVEQFGKLATLVRCTLHTGRTHQIRVHMKFLGHPLLGDSTYGWKVDERMKAAVPRVMLHSERLGIQHPVTGKKMEFRAPLPKDFEKLLVALRKAAKLAAIPPKVVKTRVTARAHEIGRTRD